MKVLIIDDSDYKIAAIQSFLLGWRQDLDVHIAKSFQSGAHALSLLSPQLVLLDMSLPTSQTPDGQLEGRPRIFGGRELLAEMEFLEIRTSVIVISQFDHFGEPPNSIDSVTLFSELSKRFPERFVRGIYYSNTDSAWQEELKVTLSKLALNQ